jgi:hypothetical protein
MNRGSQLSIVAPGATAREAAAVIAAVERFRRDRAPVIAPAPSRPPAWLQASLHEGVARQPGLPLQLG